MDGLKICRAKRGLTQAELADALHVRQSTVAMWETNGSYPRADMLPDRRPVQSAGLTGRKEQKHVCYR